MRGLPEDAVFVSSTFDLGSMCWLFFNSDSFAPVGANCVVQQLPVFHETLEA